MFYQVSEYVSPGHPDKIADGISSYLLDRYLEKDPSVRFAVETVVKGSDCVLAGELTSTAEFQRDEIARLAREAYAAIGYTDEYADKWGRDNVCGASDLNVTQIIDRQSPDISQGVDGGGWGDQGVFWGMAIADPSTGFMPGDCWLARRIGSTLYHRAKAEGICGLDIKVLVVLDHGVVEQLIVVAPLTDGMDEHIVLDAIRDIVGIPASKIVLNGSGRYVVHGIVGDSGLTGRKLAVDFYGSNCVMGGGSPWAKDGTKADVALNLLARRMAREQIAASPETYGGICRCGLSCAIGKSLVKGVYTDAAGNVKSRFEIDLPPSKLIATLGLDKPNYFNRVLNGLFADVD